MSINPNAKVSPKTAWDIRSLAKGISNGNISMLSKGITLMESRLKEDRLLATKLIELLPKVKNVTFRIGITGNPGAGKSTLIERLGNRYIENGLKVAVLAIDPSSSSSGGSILGDKTRMEQLSRQNEAFIRPSSSSGTLGGVGRSTREIIHLCEAAGYDRIIVETVGVGQNETAVENFVDCFVLIAIPGAGDEIQGIKRGIIERADIIAVNKADGAQTDLAKIALGFFKNVVHLYPREDKWSVPAISISAVENNGIDRLLKLVEKCCRFRFQDGYLEFRRKKQNEVAFEKNWKSQIIFELLEKKDFQKIYMIVKNKIQNADLSPEKGTDLIVKKFLEKIKTLR